MARREMTEEQFEHRLTGSYLLGQRVGWEAAIGSLMRMSGEAFGKRQDDRARALREAADLLLGGKENAEDAERKHAKAFPNTAPASGREEK